MLNRTIFLEHGTVDCTICDYKCLSDGGMKRHTREVHTVSTSEELEESFMNPGEVIENAKQRPICNFECLSEDGIKRHMREVHPVSNIEEIERLILRNFLIVLMR